MQISGNIVNGPKSIN